MTENRCVVCGNIIPEGRQVCQTCEVITDKNFKSNNSEDMSNKQIEELATEIYTLFRSRPMSRALAHRLYDKGWRKQSENVIELPCKVGDTVYCIWQYSDFAKEDIPFIQETRVIAFAIDEGVLKIIPANYREMTDSWHQLLAIAFTKEEAEKALAKMKERSAKYTKGGAE